MNHQLAIDCARGARQERLVRELLAYPVRFTPMVDRFQHWTVGLSPVNKTSFKNLKNRLISVGFCIEHNDALQTITMTFPEEGTK